MELGDRWHCPACHAVMRTMRGPGVTIVPTHCGRDHAPARLTRAEPGTPVAERRCPACLTWSATAGWNRSLGAQGQAGMLVCPRCGAVSAIGDTDYRFGGEPAAEPGSPVPPAG